MTYRPDIATHSDLAAKANASTVGGLSTALNSKASQAAVDALAAAMPVPATVAPVGEAVAATTGAQTRYAREDHQHPRLTSTTYGTLAASGLSGNMMFTRTFANEPGVVLTPVIPGGTQPVTLQVETWIMSGSLYAGCTVKGYRGRALPALTSVSGILTAVITGVNAIVTALTNFNPNGGPVTGVRFSCIAVARSDV